MAAPPVPQRLHRHGDLDNASAAALYEIACRFRASPDKRHDVRDRGFQLLCDYLAQHPGQTWQQRWEASELGTRAVLLTEVVENKTLREHVSRALGAMYALRVIRPTLAVFRANKLGKYIEVFVAAEADPALDAYIAAVQATDSTVTFKSWAVRDVCTALTVQGIPFSDLTPEAFLHHAQQTRESTSRTGLHLSKYIGHLAWQVMHSIGHFPPTTPTTLRGALRSPQFTTTEMVDRNEVIDPAIRQMLIDYLDRRAPSIEYSTLSMIGTNIVKFFWKAVERINPEQTDLRLSEDLYQQWRATVDFCEDGTPRSDPWNILGMVQAMYYDIQVWAVGEPQRWARWSASCPIPRGEMRQITKHKRRAQEKTHHQIRTLQPLLPVLVDYVDKRNAHWREVLERASAAEHDESFVHEGYRYTRIITRGDAQLIADGDRPGVHGAQSAIRAHGRCGRVRGCRVLDVGDHRNPPAQRAAHRRTHRTVAVERASIPATERGSHRLARRGAVQDGPRTRHPDVRGAVPCHCSDHDWLHDKHFEC
ncbi:hypothetical protein ACFQZZ_00585 [Nocardia sp. GCM10030253]|uniref:hypothetical protein n=1 Tax=Nocardia sp. GCM10030253 TaxID=3273404 RepID=UPI003630ADE0